MTGRRTGTDWVVDIAAFAFALGVGTTVLFTTRDAHGGVGWLVDLALGLVSLAAETGLVGVNAALAQQGFRRPPVRRALPWRRP
jgi:hypothetical protein